MTENKDLPAFPFSYENRDGDTVTISGLSKREYFAGLAMQSMLSDVEVGRWIQTDQRYNNLNFKEVVAMNAVEFAEALLSELNKTKP